METLHDIRLYLAYQHKKPVVPPRSLLPLCRWIVAAQRVRPPFEVVASHYLPVGISSANCGTWWSEDEYRAWLDTAGRALRHSSKRHVTSTTERVTPERRGNTQGQQHIPRPYKPRRDHRPPDIFKYVSIAGLSADEAVAKLQKLWPSWVR